MIPAVCVIFLSAVFHEYVMMFALGFFYPVLFLLFGVVGCELMRVDTPSIFARFSGSAAFLAAKRRRCVQCPLLAVHLRRWWPSVMFIFHGSLR